MKKVLFIGKTPPPFGGVTVHVSRFVDLLNKEPWFFHMTGMKKYSRFNFIRIIHFVTSNNFHVIHFNYLLCGAAAIKVIGLKLISGTKIIVTYHNSRFADSYRSMSLFNKVTTRLFLKYVDTLITVNPATKFKYFDSSNIVAVSPYINPSSYELNYILPDVITAFRAKFDVLITANASCFAFYQGEDLYGIDLSIELMKRLKNSYEGSVGFVFVVPSSEEDSYSLLMQERILEFGLEECFLLHQSSISYPALIKLSDIFLRPTNTDGDAISVKESLHLRTPVIASDASKRPDGVIPFSNRDIEDLYRVTIILLNNLDGAVHNLSALSIDNSCVTDLLTIYTDLLGERITLNRTVSSEGQQ